MSTHEEPSSAEVNWSDSRCCIISVPYHLIGKSVAERYAPIWGYSNRFCVAASTTRARHKSEAICPNPANRKNPGVHHTARQSRDGVPSGPGSLGRSEEHTS